MDKDPMKSIRCFKKPEVECILMPFTSHAGPVKYPPARAVYGPTDHTTGSVGSLAPAGDDVPRYL